MATKGPWTIQPLNMDKFPESEFGYPQRIVANDDGLVLVAECLQEPLTPDNARLIVHAPTDLAAALRVIEAAKEVVEVLGELGLPPVTILRSTINAFEAAS
jgi:hypothetical protein